MVRSPDSTDPDTGRNTSEDDCSSDPQSSAPDGSRDDHQRSFHPERRFRRSDPPEPQEIVDSRRPVSFTNLVLGFLGLASAAPLERLFVHYPWIFAAVIVLILFSVPLLNRLRRRVYLTERDLIVKSGGILEVDYVVVPLRHIQWIRLRDGLLTFMDRRTLEIHAPVVDLEPFRFHWVPEADDFANQILKHSGIGVGRLFGSDDPLPGSTVRRDEGIDGEPSTSSEGNEASYGETGSSGAVEPPPAPESARVDPD